MHWPADMRDALRGIDTDREQDIYMRAIQTFHMGPERGWADFAYNFAVFQDGRVYRGRGLDWQPAAQENHNMNTIAVLCVVGDTEKPTRLLVNGLIELKDHIDRKCGRDVIVRPHSAATSTQCPGPHVSTIVSQINRH